MYILFSSFKNPYLDLYREVIVFCDGFEISYLVLSGLKSSTLPSHSGILHTVTENCRVLDGLLWRGKCWLKRSHDLGKSSRSPPPKPFPQRLSVGQIESKSLGSPGETYRGTARTKDFSVPRSLWLDKQAAKRMVRCCWGGGEKAE